MNNLLLHPKTLAAVENVISNQPHAVLIVGEVGAGKRSVGLYLAARLLDVDNPTDHPYFIEVTPEAKTVSIDQIRELNRFLHLKVPGRANIKRVAVVSYADSMTTEAQNALLKTLEEPPEDTVLILTAAGPQNILPTIHSRVQRVMVNQPFKDATLLHFSSHTLVDVERAHGLSNGQVGLMTALLSQSHDHELAQSIEQAKELYRLTPYERLVILDSLAKQKEALPNLLYACKRIATSGMQQAATKGQTKIASAWHGRLKHIVSAEEALRHNVNTKLLLTDLFIHL